MTNIREELATLMSTLNAEKFRLLIQAYLKERYKTTDIFITDGPYDGGNDLEIRIDTKTIKRNIQITVQKNDIEKKVKEDVEKSSSNVKDYSYLNKLDFYTNQRISKSKADELKLSSELEHSIELTIYDGNILAQLNEEYPLIKKKTLELLEIKVDEELIKIDKQSKILFDLLAMGNEAGEVKKQFIYSFVFTYLFEKPNSTIEEIMSYVSGKLPDVNDLKFYRDALSSLKGKRVVITDESKKLFSLSDDKKKEIEKIYEKALMQESLLKELLQGVLKKYDLESETNHIATFLYETYKENYKIDLDELTQKSLSVNTSIRKVYQDLQKQLARKISSDDAEKLTSEIIEACNSNEYLNKIGASILFANLYESNKLDEYLNNRKQDCYFDTQALLHLICYQYYPSEYEDIGFLSVKSLYETINQYKEQISLNTSYDYLTEVSGHIQEALKLQRFLSLPLFENFKVSKNVFFNYYQYLQKNGLIEKELTLEEFIDDVLDLDTPAFNDPEFVYIVSLKLKSIFEILDINVIYHPSYEHFSTLKKEYEITLAYLDKSRSWFARENDLRMIIYLSDITRHVDTELGIRTEPYLVTWDKVFYEFRKVIMSRFKLLGYGYWYIYSPAKLADKFSVMNYKLNSESIDYNIISLTESSFNVSSKSATFLDTISLFFDKENVSELKLANRLLELESRIRDVHGKPETIDIAEQVTPLVEVLNDLRSHYTKPEAIYKFNDIIALFEEDNFEYKITQLLERSLESYRMNDKKVEESIFISFDSLISEHKIETAGLSTI